MRAPGWVRWLRRSRTGTVSVDITPDLSGVRRNLNEISGYCRSELPGVSMAEAMRAANAFTKRVRERMDTRPWLAANQWAYELEANHWAYNVAWPLVCETFDIDPTGTHGAIHTALVDAIIDVPAEHLEQWKAAFASQLRVERVRRELEVVAARERAIGSNYVAALFDDLYAVLGMDRREVPGTTGHSSQMFPSLPS